MKPPKVKQIGSNHFIIEHKGIEYLQSYDSIIIKNENGNITLDRKTWDYSRTTGKYRNDYLNENKNETERKINNGIYKLDDLN